MHLDSPQLDGSPENSIMAFIVSFMLVVMGFLSLHIPSVPIEVREWLQCFAFGSTIFTGLLAYLNYRRNQPKKTDKEDGNN
jgi:hypothetical protein